MRVVNRIGQRRRLCPRREICMRLEYLYRVWSAVLHTPTGGFQMSATLQRYTRAVAAGEHHSRYGVDLYAVGRFDGNALHLGLCGNVEHRDLIRSLQASEQRAIAAELRKNVRPLTLALSATGDFQNEPIALPSSV